MHMAVFPSVLQAALDQFDGRSEQQLLEAREATKITAPLYHYTDAAGLLGIVGNQHFRFTSYLHLNDPSELRYGIDVATEVLEEIGTAEGIVKLFCGMVADLFKHQNLSDTFGFFVGSFSRARDDLGQWRSYGDNGRGFAIGLSPDLFQIEDKPDRKPHENVFVAPVVYGSVGTRQRHHDAIRTAANILTTARDQHADILRDKTVGIPFLRAMADSLMASQLVWNCLTSKHEAYNREQEVRLVILGTLETLQPHIDTRTRKGEVVPFIRSAMPLQKKGGIVEVVVGPSAPPNAEDSVRTFLRSFDVDDHIPVRRSTIPYRAL